MGPSATQAVRPHAKGHPGLNETHVSAAGRVEAPHCLGGKGRDGCLSDVPEGESMDTLGWREGFLQTTGWHEDKSNCNNWSLKWSRVTEVSTNTTAGRVSVKLQ